MNYRALICPTCKTKMEPKKVIYGGYGCPIKTCPQCGQMLLDAATKEPALKSPFKYRLAIVLDLCQIFFAAWVVCMLITSMILDHFFDMADSWALLIFGTIASLLVLFAWLKRHPIDLEEMDREVAESIKRLDDPKYADFLQNVRIFIYEDSIYCAARGKDKANDKSNGKPSRDRNEDTDENVL